MREPAVMLAHSARDWAKRVHFFLMDHGGAFVRGYVVSADDALDQQYDVLLVDDVTSFLSRRLVETLRRRGIGVVGLYDEHEADGAGRDRLLDLGVDAAMAADASAEMILGKIVEIAGPFVDDSIDDLIGYAGSGVRGAVDAAPGSATSRGVIVAVAAASGGAGATEVSIALAAALRDNEVSTLLVDADEQAPAVAQRLGLGLHPNIRTAVDAVIHGSGDLDSSLNRLTSIGIEVLCGLPNPRDWSELRADEAGVVLSELASTRAQIVANVGPRIDDLAVIGGPGRFSLTRTVLAAADVVVLVGSATPTGAARVIEWMAGGRRLVAGKPLHLVINDHHGGSYGAAEIEAEIRNAVSVRSVTVAPHDPRVLRSAWDGDAVRRGPFIRAISGLARVIAPVGATR